LALVGPWLRDILILILLTFSRFFFSFALMAPCGGVSGGATQNSEKALGAAKRKRGEEHPRTPLWSLQGQPFVLLTYLMLLVWRRALFFG